MDFTPYAQDAFVGLFVFLLTKGLQELSKSLPNRDGLPVFSGAQVAVVAGLLSALFAVLVNQAALQSPDAAHWLRVLVDFVLTWTASAGINFAAKKTPPAS